MIATPAGTPTVIMASLVEIFRACLIPNIHIYASHSPRRFVMIGSVFISGFCSNCDINVRVMSSGFSTGNSMVESTTTITASPITDATIAGMKPYPVNSRHLLNEPFPLNSTDMA